MSEDGKTKARRRQSAAIFSIVTSVEATPRTYLVARLAVPVVEVLDTADHAEAAERDLVRARVEAHVVRPARAVDEHHAALVACSEPVRHAAARRTRDDVAGLELVLFPLRTAIGLERRRPEMKRRRALEDDEDLLFLGMAVRDRARLPRQDALPVEAREARALGGREWRRLDRAAVRHELDLVDVQDVLRARLRLSDLERRDRCLDVPRVVVAPLDPRPARPDRARPRQPCELRRVARPEDEELEPVVACDKRVLEVVGGMDHAVVRAKLVDVAVLPCEPRPGEDVVDLLGGAVRVRRRRQLSRRDANAVQPDLDRAGGGTELLPDGVHLSYRRPVLGHLVPVRETHGPRLHSVGA